MDIDDTPPAPGALTHPLGDWDWIALGKVTPVKTGNLSNNCVTGPIFAAVGAYESLMWINNMTNGTTFSERQVYDCISGVICPTTPQAVWNFTKIKGIVTDALYPWTNNSTRNCTSPTGPNTMNWYTSAINNCAWMQTAIQTAPVAAYSYPNQLMYYTNGTFNCSGSNSGSYVAWLVVVGYTNSTWTAKNSWGTGWGNAGFITIAAAANGTNGCGLCTSALLPNLS